MKRYIEIVYDNSGSMNDMLGNKTKYQVAQELFEKEILPTIGIKGDHVVLRLLRDNCNGKSIGEVLNNSRVEMLSKIKSISHYQSTPLFHTVFDAVEACKKEKADEYIIFVLTDGDDTCRINFNEIVDQDTIDKYVKTFNVLLVQLAVDSDISSNNLTAFTSYLGGQTIILGNRDSFKDMRNKIKVALGTSGISKKYPIQHCYKSQPGFDMDWSEVENMGIGFYEASMLFAYDLIDWEPLFDKKITALQLSELKFLTGLFFKSNLPIEYVKAMLSQLQKPYYYSHNCIYWDFSGATWKYFKIQNQFIQVDNPDAHIADGNKDVDLLNNHFDLELQTFDDYNVYKVELSNKSNTSFNLIPKGNTDYNKIIRPGDLLKFKK